MSKGIIVFKNNPKAVSKTRQEFQRECNINTIIARSKKTGILGDPTRSQKAFFGDVSSIPDLQTFHNKMIEINDAFMSLNPEVRLKFENDPIKCAEYLNTLDTDEKLDEAREMGLIKPLTDEELKQRNEAKILANKPPAA